MKMKMYVEGQPTLMNCTFADNATDQFGGGFYNEGGDPTIVNCVFSGNSARNGGGMFDEFHFQPTVVVNFIRI